MKLYKGNIEDGYSIKYIIRKMTKEINELILYKIQVDTSTQTVQESFFSTYNFTQDEVI